MSLSLNKIVLAGSGAVTNTAGAYYQITSVTIPNTTATGIVLPAGVWQVPATANVSINLNTSSNANALSFVAVIPANTAGLVIADGVNVYANTSVANTVVTLYGSNGGQAVSGTYNH